MNLSGLSYLQFSLVDGFVLVYMFMRVHMVRGWAEINPISVMRLSPRNRGSGVVTLVGFYSCVFASALFLAKDAIMAGQELDDVALCRTAVYLQQKVTPLDSEQQPGINKGLALWDVGSGLQLLALGCVMCNWASATVQQMLGASTLMRSSTGKGMLGFGAIGLVGAVVSHGVAFHSYGDDSASARSVARIVSSVFFIGFLGALAYTTWFLTRILRHAVARDSAATASLVHSTFTHSGGYPMATMKYLLSMQMLSFMRDSAVHMCVLLFLRALFFMAFDISYLTPQQLAISNLAENNVFTGIGTLAASLMSAVAVQTLLPARQHVVGAVLAKAATELEDSPGARLAFIDGQHLSSAGRLHGSGGSMMPVPKLAGSMSSRNHSLSNAGGDATLRSRAPTTASLAVEKATGGSWGVAASARQLNSSIPAVPAQASSVYEKPPFGDYSVDGHYAPTADSAQSNTNYLDQIPYIDRSERENSFFSQGPWTHPVTRTMSPHPFSESTTTDGVLNSSNASVPHAANNSTTSNPFVNSRKSPPQQQRMEEHVPNSSFIFSDEEDDDRPRTSRAQQADSAFIPLSSSNVALNSSNAALSRSTVALTQRDPADRSASGSNDLTDSIGSNMTRPSNGQSLHAEALTDAAMSPTAAMPTDGEQRPDSIVSSYIRPDNGGSLPMIRRLFVGDNRPPSFVSADYQYEPGESGNIRVIATSPNNPFEDAMGSPMQPDQSRTHVPSVYVADANAEASDSRDLSTPGPILIRKGSKASVRRKGTVERRHKKADNSNEPIAESGSGDSSSRSSSDGNNNSNAGEQPEKMSQRVTRMSAFSGAPIKLAALLGKASASHKDKKADPKMSSTAGNAIASPPLDDMKRDSSTISNIDWDQSRSKHASEVSAAPAAGPFAADPHGHRHQFRRLSRDPPSSNMAEGGGGGGGGASLPSSLFKGSVSSIGSQQSNDVFASFASMHSTGGGGNDAFYTPEASLAQINNPDQAAPPRKLQTSDPDILATPVASMPASEERPSTAPTSASAGYRHTMEATSSRELAQGVDDDEDRAATHGPSSSATPKRNSIRMRRAQTLRKAVDTDALAIETSIHASENDEYADALMSAMPMPEPSSLSGNRVIL
ncbi:hypothetical protein LPJ59_002702 [Coemansia sp. RSA 2399]|nr:hypothetical protein LPJ59_002702 [Coemansia sp. RSA 2399]KAJ1904706.1 hypothetical protein LPJ81_002337 [Coemansia sp. IMI 209127]